MRPVFLLARSWLCRTPAATVTSAHVALVGLALGLGSASGCYSAADGGPQVEACLAPTPAPVAMRRLSDRELERVLTALMGTPVTLSLPRDPTVDGYDNHVETLIVSPPKLDGYLDVAETFAPKLAERSACEPTETPRACAFRIASAWARALYGRALDDDEANRLMDLAESGGLVLVAKAMLLSPFTLYRSELGAADATALQERIVLSHQELASALSFAVTGTRPSLALQEAAARGELDTAEGRVAHARTLLATPLGRAQMRRFVRAWLGVARLDEAPKYQAVFPDYAALRDSMDREVDRFVEVALFESETGALRELFDTARVYPDERLAEFYRDEITSGPDAFGGAAVDASKRRGVISLAGFLARHAGPDATNPVARGLAVRARILCDDFGAPPIAAQMATIDRSDTTTTTREKFERHVNDPQCAGCHRAIDSVGFGLESFDGVGRHRTSENGKPVNAVGEIVGTDVAGTFEGPAGLSSKLAGSEQMRRCFVTQLRRFAEGGRDPNASCDDDLVRGLEHGRATDVLLRWVARDAFVMRRRTP